MVVVGCGGYGAAVRVRGVKVWLRGLSCSWLRAASAVEGSAGGAQSLSQPH